MGPVRTADADEAGAGLGLWTGVVLAGGSSTRMGRDKAWLSLDGEPMVVRQTRLLSKAGATEVLISGRSDVDYSRCGARVVLDANPGQGPLGGIAAALIAARHPLVFILAVDLPRVDAEMTALILGRASAVRGAVPWVHGAAEPLVAAYPRSLAASARSWLETGRRSVRGWVEALLNEGVVQRVDVPERLYAGFANWNTPEDCEAQPPLGERGASP
ncbi:MAG: molybdenum cofactor guanylyltransferase [Verrucomicrobiales bacterium]|nr:molybdenum cofactor guanylyltransferase [Verrucomicrobiales bacterium]